MSDKKGHNQRMGDKENIPPMNGTIGSLVTLIGTPMDTPEQQAQALREFGKLLLHIYLGQKNAREDAREDNEKMENELGKIRDDLGKLLEERKGIIARVIDKGVVPLMYFIFFALLQLAFSSLKP